jgi:hypothetical protein
MRVTGFEVADVGRKLKKSDFKKGDYVIYDSGYGTTGSEQDICHMFSIGCCVEQKKESEFVLVQRHEYLGKSVHEDFGRVFKCIQATEKDKVGELVYRNMFGKQPSREQYEKELAEVEPTSVWWRDTFEDLMDKHGSAARLKETVIHDIRQYVRERFKKRGPETSPHKRKKLKK